MCDKRILRELKDLDKGGNVHDIHIVDDTLHHLQATLRPHSDSIYHGGTFYLDIRIMPDYPFKAPVCRLLTRIYHPQINEEGGICSFSARRADDWIPGSTIEKFVDKIHKLLSFPHKDDCLMPRIFKEFTKDPELFNLRAREYVEKYAK